MPRGEAIAAELGEAYLALRSPADGLVLLVGKDHPSRLTVVSHPIELPSFTEDALLSDEAEITDAECVSGAFATTMPPVRFPFEAPSGLVGIRLVLTRTQGQGAGAAGLNVALIDGSGDRVASTTATTGTETLVLYGPNLENVEPGTWKAQVSSGSSQNATFGIAVEALRDPSRGATTV